MQRVVALLVLFFVAACSDDGPSGNGTSIQISVSPASLTLTQGNSGSATVTVMRMGGFAGTIALAVTGLPAGVTATVTPAQLDVMTTTATINVTTTSATAVASHALTVTASAPGVAAATASLSLNVAAAPAAGAVEYRFCDVAETPVFLAYQDGSGTWQPVTGVAAGGTTRFTFNISQGRGGVLAVYRSSDAAQAVGSVVAKRTAQVHARPASLYQDLLVDVYHTQLTYATLAELTQDGLEGCPAAPSLKSANVTVAGVPLGSYGILSYGHTTEIFDPAAPANPITFEEVPTGLNDFVAVRTSPGNPPDRIFLTRNVDVPDGASLPSVNFNGAGALTPAVGSVTVNGAGGHLLEAFVDLVTANSQLGLWFDLNPSVATTRTWAGLNTANMLAADFHMLAVFAHLASQPADYRVALKYVRDVGTETITLGPVINAPAISSTGGGSYPRLRIQGSIPVEYNKGIAIDVFPANVSGNSFSVLATAAHLAAAGSAATYDFTMPDITGLAGFPAAARLTAGPNDVFVSPFGFNGPGLFDAEPVLGSEFRSAVRTTTVNVQ